MPDVLKEVCLRVLVGEGCHVGESWVGGVRAHQVGEEGDTFVTGKLCKRREDGREDRRGGEGWEEKVERRGSIGEEE